MIELYHTNGWGNLEDARLLGTFPDKIQCMDAVTEFTKTHNSYYTRIIDNGNQQIILDYGSYTKFLLIKGISFEEYTKPITTCLWLDDERDPRSEAWDDVHDKMSTWIDLHCPMKVERVVWVKNFDEFTNWIWHNKFPDVVCFDHDLGEEKTGYDVAKWLCDYCQMNFKPLPKFACHSMNPVGKQNILTYLNNFKKHVENTKTYSYQITLEVDKEVLQNTHPNFSINYPDINSWVETTLKGAFDIEGVSLKIK